MTLRWRLLNAVWLLVTGETYESRERKVAALRRVWAEMSESEKRAITEHRRMWN